MAWNFTSTVDSSRSRPQFTETTGRFQPWDIGVENATATAEVTSSPSFYNGVYAGHQPFLNETAYPGFIGISPQITLPKTGGYLTPVSLSVDHSGKGETGGLLIGVKEPDINDTSSVPTTGGFFPTTLAYPTPAGTGGLMQGPQSNPITDTSPSLVDTLVDHFWPDIQGLIGNQHSHSYYEGALIGIDALWHGGDFSSATTDFNRSHEQSFNQTSLAVSDYEVQT